ncbi:hypothetical protein BCR44DRAFT_217565, partial [Catenaria anguillulae PL171]
MACGQWRGAQRLAPAAKFSAASTSSLVLCVGSATCTRAIAEETRSLRWRSNSYHSGCGILSSIPPQLLCQIQ